MPSVKDNVAFILLRRSEKPEHRILRRLRGKEVIVSPVDHKGGHRHPGREIDFVHFGQFLAEVKSSTDQHKHLDSSFERGKNVPEIGSPTQAVISELFVVEVLYASRCSQLFFPGLLTSQ